MLRRTPPHYGDKRRWEVNQMRRRKHHKNTKYSAGSTEESTRYTIWAMADNKLANYEL